MSGAPHLFPLFLRLAGREVLVVGGGAMAATRVAQLAAAGARVTVVSPQIREEIRASGAELRQRPFEPADLDDAWLAVAAATPEVNRAVAREAERRRVFLNAVDDPSNATAFTAGVVRRGEVAVAVSTDGRAPALAGLLREGIDALLPPTLGEWVEHAESLRADWKARGIPLGERRGLLLEALVARYAKPSPETP